MNWERVNIWTNTLYTLIHSLHIAKEMKFGELDSLDDRIKDSITWITPICNYSSVLLNHKNENMRLKFRRNPNKHFDDITKQVIKMLIQDLTVILDDMMNDALSKRNEKAGIYPQSKVEKLRKALKPNFQWSANGCLELIAARNVLTHNQGKWNEKSIAVVEKFVFPNPKINDRLIIGFPMLFNYRKAMRTFLNEAVRDC